MIQLYDMVKIGARVQIIDTTQNQAIAANIVQPAAPPVNVPGSPPAAVAGAAPAAATPAAPAKKEWVGTPAALLAKQNAAEAKARATAKPPVGAAPSAKPVSQRWQRRREHAGQRGHAASLGARLAVRAERESD